MTSPATALETLRDAASAAELNGFCRRHGVRVLTVFGSAARGERDANDLDIGVLTEVDRPLDIASVAIELVTLTGFDRIDVVHLNREGPLVRERAFVASVGLYESEPAALANAQMAAMAERIDVDVMRRMTLGLPAG